VSEVELQTHQLLRPVMQVEIDESRVCIVRTVVDGKRQAELLLLLSIVVPHQVKSEFFVVLPLSNNNVVFLAVAVVARVVARTGVVSGVHWSVQLCDGRWRATKILLFAHEVFE